MDLFPTGLLESIVTAKTFTPDMPGDFSGGSVNLREIDARGHVFFFFYFHWLQS